MDRSKRNPGTSISLSSSPESRLVSLDVLRGFAVFWVIVANTVQTPERFMADSETVNSLAARVDHREWEGFSAADLFFPLFVFMVGTATVLSLGKALERGGRPAAYRRMLRRFVLLFLFGVFYTGGLTYRWPDVQLTGILQRLAICSLAAGLLFCHLRPRGLLVVFVTILAGYWAWLTFVPVPGVGKPSYEQGANWAWYIDKFYLPGRKGQGDWDREGLLSTIPAVASCLWGVLAGELVMSKSVSDWRKLLYLVAGGITTVGLGFLWGLQFPVNKSIWTSSFVLVAGGYSCLMLAGFYLVVDVWKFRWWTPYFLWLGNNALAMYLAINIVDFRAMAARFVGGDVHAALGRYGNTGITVASLILVSLLARYMYRKQIFLRV